MIEKLSKIISADRIKENVDMSRFSTFRTGGKAAIFITPENTSELQDIIKFFCEARISYYILGNGSNILVSDRGLKNPVIHIGKNMSSVSVFENCITALGGASLAKIAAAALENSLGGMEFAAGIPGTLGGAVIMNAGAYGGEMKKIIEAVSYIDPLGESRVASCEEMEFSYRKSALSDSGCIVTAASIKLETCSKEIIASKMNELAQKRREKQPLEYPSAGSTFKRPEGHFAGTLIESTGLKGKNIGGAYVSEKHAGFIINKGGATSNDILCLIKYVQEKVYEKHGIMLEPEVKLWMEEENYK